MQNLPLPHEHGSTNTSFSLQPPVADTAAEPGRHDDAGGVWSGPVCLFSGCGRIFPDEVALHNHQQYYHLRFLPEHAVSYATNTHSATQAIQSTLADYALPQTDPQIDFQNRLNPAYHNNLHPSSGAGYSPNAMPQQAQVTPSFLGAMPTQHATGYQPQMPLTHHIGPRNTPSARVHCPHPGCSTSVSRPSDLPRHRTTHQVGLREFDCPAPGCGRKGLNGFPRNDKMWDHYRTVHQ